MTPERRFNTGHFAIGHAALAAIPTGTGDFAEVSGSGRLPAFLGTVETLDLH
jgi:hypothetical protein